MCYTTLLKNKVYFIHGKFNSEKKFKNKQPWGEVDWQSGKERWKLTCNALFDGYYDQFSEISLLPEAVNFIDSDSICFKNNFFEFESLTVFQNNPYFNIDNFDALAFGKNGKFANGKLPNGAMRVFGEFSIIRIAESSELVTWINDVN